MVDTCIASFIIIFLELCLLSLQTREISLLFTEAE